MVARHASEEYAAHPYFAKGEEIAQRDTLPLHEIAMDILANYLPKGSRVIDVGAGTGDFIELAAEYFAVSAIEPSTFLAEKIKTRVACPVFVGAFEDYRQPESADAVILMDILEHAADPRKLLAQVKQTLRPDGLVFISTVDSASLLYRLGPLVWKLSKHSRLAAYLLHRIFCKQHNWYFNRRVLGDIVKAAGFTVLDHQGFEFPLSRLKEAPLILLGLRAVYFLHSLLGANTEQYLVAKNSYVTNH